MRILLADDSATLRKAVAAVLQAEGHEITEAVDGVEAITRFAASRPDLVILDADMPRLGGHVVCRLLKEDAATAAVPVLMLTGRDQASDEYWSDRSGADGYLVKQRVHDELIATVNALEARRALSELSAGGEPPGEAIDDHGVLIRVCEMLENELAEATMLHELVSLVLEPATPSETARDVAELVARFVGADGVAIASLRERIIRAWLAAPATPDAARDFEDRVAEEVRRAGAAEELDFVRTDSHAPDVEGIASWAAWESTPVRSATTTSAVVVVASVRPVTHRDELRRVVRSVAPTAAAVVRAAVDRAVARQAKAAEALRSLA